MLFVLICTHPHFLFLISKFEMYLKSGLTVYSVSSYDEVMIDREELG